MTATALPTAPSVPAEVVAFLIQLAVALHKQRAYPTAHPMRLDAHANAVAALGRALGAAPSLRIGIARDQLLIGDAATDPAHFIVRDLAIRLHRRQLGSITFRAGATADEVGQLIEQLSVESANRRDAPPLPTGSEHVEVAAIAFDALGLQDGDPAAGDLDRVWHDLAFAVGGNGSAPGLTDPAFARLLLERLGAAEGRSEIAGALERVGRLTRDLDGAARESAEARLRDLLATVPDDALGLLLDVDLGSREEIGRLVPSVDWLPAAALVEVVEAAAKAQKQEISNVLLRLLQKLARQARGTAPRPVADHDLRHVVKGLLEDWTLADPNSRSHAHILDVLSRRDGSSSFQEARLDDPIRLVQTALEVEAEGDHLIEAVEQVIARGEIGALVALLDAVELGPVVDAAWRAATSPPMLRSVLADANVPPEIAAAVISRVDGAGVGTLLERLFEPTPDHLRMLIAVRLADLDAHLGPELERRLAQAGSVERRQLLAIAARLPNLPTGVDLTPYLASVDPLTRVEAYRFAIRRPDTRDEAIHGALADDDEAVVAVAIEAGKAGLPRQSLSRLMVLLNASKRTEELRALAVELLRQFDVPTTRQWLLSGLVVRRRWFRLKRLAPKSPLVLAKLRALAARWRGTPDVDRALALARRSGDPELAAAADGGTP